MRGLFDKDLRYDQKIVDAIKKVIPDLWAEAIGDNQTARATPHTLSNLKALDRAMRSSASSQAGWLEINIAGDSNWYSQNPKSNQNPPSSPFVPAIDIGRCSQILHDVPQ